MLGMICDRTVMGGGGMMPRWTGMLMIVIVMVMVDGHRTAHLGNQGNTNSTIYVRPGYTQNAGFSKPGHVHMGCKELRSKRYISDGYCTSVKPLTEVVCSGSCLPVNELPWYSEYLKLRSRKVGEEWNCIDDIIRKKRVHLLCENGEHRSYTVKVVRGCKCKKGRKPENKTSHRRGE
jgi:hypothetical protein